MNADKIIGEWAKFLSFKDFQATKKDGGINNSVFVLETGRKKFIIKIYPKNRHGSLRRLKAESDFLSYANSVCPEFTPKLIAVNQNIQSILMEYCEGTSIADISLNKEKGVHSAVLFMKQLNNKREEARKVISQQATEGFHRISEHIENVRLRLKTLNSNHISKKLRDRSNSIIEKLHTTFNITNERVKKHLNNSDHLDRIIQDSFFVSPGDFGFHNAIMKRNSIIFLDFEYSGWDDPAKIIIDFFLQPRVPISENEESFSKFIEVFTQYTEKQKLLERIRILRPILCIKWMTIIVSFLNPEREFASKFNDKNAENQLERCEKFFIANEENLYF